MEISVRKCKWTKLIIVYLFGEHGVKKFVKLPHFRILFALVIISTITRVGLFKRYLKQNKYVWR